MSLKIETINRLMWRYWQPEKAKPEEVHQIADEILKMAKQGSSLVELKTELARIQVNRLRQKLDAAACDEIATRIFAASHA